MDNFQLNNESTCLNKNIVVANIDEKSPQITPNNEEQIKKEKKSKKSKKPRCFVCNKKTGLIPYKCRCGEDKLFCAKHRYPEQHACTYDWKNHAKENIMKQNPKIVADKFGGNRIN
ncbi:hypothetical protein CPAV1605_123 [seawater metagenome]|uniref:AN1-type domain-containing protein n=1 Tax=seawater metagenome TaxID=1561972 RepID=A0A5E8CGU5_9ZZZZ